MKRIIVLLFVAVLSACATTTDAPVKNGFLASLQQWVGRPIDAMVAVRGAPDSVYMLDSGGRVFEFSMAVALTRAEMDWLAAQSKRGSSGRITPKPDTRPPADSRSEQLSMRVLGSGKTCKVAFNVSADSIIKSWKIEDETCF